MEITALAFSGAFLVAARDDGRVEAWRIGEPSTSRVLRTAGDEPVRDLATDGERVFGVAGSRLLVWDAGLDLQADDEFSCSAHFVSVTPDGIWLAGDEQLVRIAPDLSQGWSHSLPPGSTTDFDVHPSGTHVVVVKDALHVRVHDGENLKPLHTWSRESDRNAQHVSVRFTERPDHLWMTVNRSYEVHRVSARKGHAVREKTRHSRRLESAWAGPVALCGERRHLAVLQNGSDVHLWDLDLERPTFFAEPVVDTSPEKFWSKLSRVPKLAAAGPGAIKVTKTSRQPDRDAAVTALAVAPKGTMLALGGRDGTILRCDTRSGGIEQLGAPAWLVQPRCAAVTRWPTGALHGLRGDEPWIVRDGVLARLDLEHPDRLDGVPLEDYPPTEYDHARSSPELFFHDDLVYRLAHDRILAWDSSTGRLASMIATPGVPHLAGDFAYLTIDTPPARDRFPLWRFDLGVRRLERIDDVVIDTSAVDVRAGVANWAHLYTVGTHVGIRMFFEPEVAFLIDPEQSSLTTQVPTDFQNHPTDGNRVFAATSDGYRRIDLDDATTLERRFSASLGTVRWERELSGGRALGFQRDSLRIVIASWQTGELLHSLCGHGHHVHPMFMSPDENSLLSVDAAGFVRLWRL